MIRCSVDRNDDRLEDERDRGGDVEMRRVLNISLPGDRKREHERMQRENMEERREAVLIELHEAHEHEGAREKMRDIEIEAAHQRLRDTNRRRVASRPSIKAPPRNSGTRKTRIFAIDISKAASRNPMHKSFAT